MRKHARTLQIIETARAILAKQNPMTVRQVYYQLVSRQVIENNRSQYQAVSNVLVDARKNGIIEWDWIEDRLRKLRKVGMWQDFADFVDDVRLVYRRDVWISQTNYIETWLEKDALSGIFENVLRPYGITLNVGRGYDGWDSIHNAAERFNTIGKPSAILYFGDFDPSGEDMARSLRERLAFFDCEPEIIKCALTLDDVERYHLPPDKTKQTDTRRAAFVEKNGDICVELDALPVDVLRARIGAEVEKRMDLDTLRRVREQELKDLVCLGAMLKID